MEIGKKRIVFLYSVAPFLIGGTEMLASPGFDDIQALWKRFFQNRLGQKRPRDLDEGTPHRMSGEIFHIGLNLSEH